MNEEPYQNREIREMFEEVKSTLTRIETQTVKTNGRVSKLETWQAYVLGFCACISIFIVPIAISLTKSLF